MPLGIVSEFDYLKEIQNQDEKESNQESGSIIEESVPESDSDSDQELNTRASESDIESESEVRMPNSDIDSGPISAFIKQLPKLGRQEGSTQVPDSLRKIIGESVIEEGRSAGTAIADFLGISQSSVSAYSKGATSTTTYNEPKKELKDHLQNTRKKISKRASGKLLKALDTIDDDKLEALDALDASTVAKNMAAIIKQMEPETNKSSVVNAPQITFFIPQISREEKFDVITVNE